jgi:hypothetical protein
MASIIRFEEYIGGQPIYVATQSPKEQKTFILTFKDDAGAAINVSGYTWEVDYQALVVDTLAFDRNTGEPNFANSKVIGRFVKGEVNVGTYVKTTSASTGVVSITIPAGVYTGPILPDARKNVPILLVGITYTTADTPPQIHNQRLAFIQAYTVDVSAGDPTLDNGYTAITLAS